MSTSLVQTGVKFPDDTVLTSTIPVGSTYVQFPGESAPNSVFGGSWSAIFDNEAIFFRTPGSGAASFGGGVQSDQMQRITGRLGGSDLSLFGRIRGTFIREGVFSSTAITTNSGRDAAGSDNSLDIINIDSANSPNARTSSSTSGETRVKNRTIRVWKRTS